MPNERAQKLDPFDLKILQLLQADAAQSAERIADEIGLSPVSVQRRIKSLKQSGVIRAQIAIVDPGALGYGLRLIVAVELDTERKDILDHFAATLAKEAQVQQSYYVTGNTDFILVILARDIEDYNAFTQRVFFGNPAVRRFTTNIVLRTQNAGLTVPCLEMAG